MPCVAMPSSASVRPLHRSASLPPAPMVSPSVYTRVWKFLLHWSSPTECIPSPTSCRRRSTPTRLSACSAMRQRVEMLHELEAQPPTERGVRAMLATCANCRRRKTIKTTDGESEYCSLDCRSSAQYRASVQHAIDCDAAFDEPATLSSSMASSRL